MFNVNKSAALHHNPAIQTLNAGNHKQDISNNSSWLGWQIKSSNLGAWALNSLASASCTCARALASRTGQAITFAGYFLQIASGYSLNTTQDTFNTTQDTFNTTEASWTTEETHHPDTFKVVLPIVTLAFFAGAYVLNKTGITEGRNYPKLYTLSSDHFSELLKNLKDGNHITSEDEDMKSIMDSIGLSTSNSQVLLIAQLAISFKAESRDRRNQEIQEKIKSILDTKTNENIDGIIAIALDIFNKAESKSQTLIAERSTVRPDDENNDMQYMELEEVRTELPKEDEDVA